MVVVVEARKRIDEVKRDTAVVLAKKRANHLTSSLLDLTTRISQEHVRILNHHRKEKEKTRKGKRKHATRKREKLPSYVRKRGKKVIIGSQAGDFETDLWKFALMFGNWRITTKWDQIRNKVVPQFKKFPRHHSASR